MPKRTAIKPILDKDICLEKFSGKGGWTYAPLPEIPIQKGPFGLKKVKGSIDFFSFSQYHLLAMGNGHLFLPVKASIRKAIKKQAGDYVRVILFEDTDKIGIPEEFDVCLKDEPQAYVNFRNLEENEQKKYLDWIYSVKKDEIKVERMAKVINELMKGRAK